MLINKQGKSLFFPFSFEVTKLSLFLATYHKIQHRTTHLRKQTNKLLMVNCQMQEETRLSQVRGSHTHGAHIYCNCRTCSTLHDSIQSNFILLIKMNSVISSHSIHVRIFKQFKSILQIILKRHSYILIKFKVVLHNVNGQFVPCTKLLVNSSSSIKYRIA